MVILYYFIGLFAGIYAAVVVIYTDMPLSVAVLVTGINTISGLLIVGILEKLAEWLIKWIEG